MIPFANHIHPALKLRLWIHTKKAPSWALWWTFPWIWLHLHTTSSNLMMAQLNHFKLRICHPWLQKPPVSSAAFPETQLQDHIWAWWSIPQRIPHKIFWWLLLVQLWFSYNYKMHINKKEEDWGVSLPNLPMNWHELCINGVLLPGHVSSLSICSASTATTFSPIANFASAINLVCDCPSSLHIALADNHPGREAWLQSHFNEKRSIEYSGLTRSSPLPNTMPSMKRVHQSQMPYPQCAYLPSKWMECLTLSALSLKLLFLVTMKIRNGIPEKYALVLCPDTMQSSAWLSNAASHLTA